MSLTQRMNLQLTISSHQKPLTTAATTSTLSMNAPATQVMLMSFLCTPAWMVMWVVYCSQYFPSPSIELPSWWLQ